MDLRSKYTSATLTNKEKLADVKFAETKTVLSDDAFAIVEAIQELINEVRRSK